MKPQALPVASVVMLLVSLPAERAQADFVVLQSGAAELEVGQILDDDAKLAIDTGEHVILLSDDGDIIEVEGPYRGAPEGAAPEDIDIRNALAELIDTTTSTHTSLGSTRGSVLRQSVPDGRDAWHLDPFYTGRQCVRDGVPPVFWRDTTERSLSLVIQRPGHEGDEALSWQAGESIAGWPADLPLVDNELYVVRRPGWMENAMIQITMLQPDIAATPSSAVAWLAARGCTRQAGILLAALP